jgi:hypothetical protein
MDYRLLDTFRGLFDGVRYLHRKSNLGDFVASHLYEDSDLSKSRGLGRNQSQVEGPLFWPDGGGGCGPSRPG